MAILKRIVKCNDYVNIICIVIYTLCTSERIYFNEKSELNSRNEFDNLM